MIRDLRFFCDATYTKKKNYATYAFFLYKKATYAKKKVYATSAKKKSYATYAKKKKLLTLISTIELRF